MAELDDELLALVGGGDDDSQKSNNKKRSLPSDDAESGTRRPRGRPARK